jgi:HEAT repeat protein
MWLALMFLQSIAFYSYAYDQEFDSMIQMLKSNDASERKRGAHLLGKAKHKAAVPFLQEVLIKDDAWFVKSWASWALAEIGDPIAIDTLIDALEKSELRWDNGKNLAATKEGRCITSFNIALEKLTGERFSTSKEWKSWRDKLKKSKLK